MRGGTVRRGGGVGLRALVVVAVAAAALVVARADTAAADGKLVGSCFDLGFFFFFGFVRLVSIRGDDSDSSLLVLFVWCVLACVRGVRGFRFRRDEQGEQGDWFVLVVLRRCSCLQVCNCFEMSPWFVLFSLLFFLAAAINCAW